MSDCIQFCCFSEKDEVIAPDYCPLCETGDVIFSYSIKCSIRKRAEERTEGFCCLRCGQQLLASLEEVLLARWGQDSQDAAIPLEPA